MGRPHHRVVEEGIAACSGTSLLVSDDVEFLSGGSAWSSFSVFTFAALGTEEIVFFLTFLRFFLRFGIDVALSTGVGDRSGTCGVPVVGNWSTPFWFVLLWALPSTSEASTSVVESGNSLFGLVVLLSERPGPHRKPHLEGEGDGDGGMAVAQPRGRHNAREKAINTSNRILPCLLLSIILLTRFVRVSNSVAVCCFELDAEMNAPLCV